MNPCIWILGLRYAEHGDSRCERLFGGEVNPETKQASTFRRQFVPFVFSFFDGLAKRCKTDRRGLRTSDNW